jgi:hypothetical protein
VGGTECLTDSKGEDVNKNPISLIAGAMPIGNLIRQMKGKQGETEMNQTVNDTEKPSFWQLVFLQSKVNGAPYNGEALPGRNWEWPKDTYLQRRLQNSKWFQSDNRAKMN